MIYEFTVFQYTFMTAVTFLIVLCYLDQNVSDWIILQTKVAIMRLQMAWMMVWLHPKNPVYTWQYNRRINKFIREYQNGIDTPDVS